MADGYNTELAMIVEAGTIATLREIPSGQLADYAYEYSKAGNSFMLGMVAKAAYCKYGRTCMGQYGTSAKRQHKASYIRPKNR